MFKCLRVGGLMFKTMMFSLEKEMKMVLKDTKNLWSDLKLREMIEFTKVPWCFRGLDIFWNHL